MSVCRSFFLKGESNSIWTKSADACSRNWRIWQPWKLRKLTAIVTQISIDNRCGTLCTVFGKEKNKRQSTVLLVPRQQVLETSGQSLCLPHWRELGNWSPGLMFFIFERTLCLLTRDLALDRQSYHRNDEVMIELISACGAQCKCTDKPQIGLRCSRVHLGSRILN